MRDGRATEKKRGRVEKGDKERKKGKERERDEGNSNGKAERKYKDENGLTCTNKSTREREVKFSTTKRRIAKNEDPKCR